MNNTIYISCRYSTNFVHISNNISEDLRTMRVYCGLKIMKSVHLRKAWAHVYEVAFHLIVYIPLNCWIP